MSAICNEGAYKIRVSKPDAAREGAFDAISMRGLFRAIRTFRRQPENSAVRFDRSFARVIEMNGTMARMIENERQKENT